MKKLLKFLVAFALIFAMAAGISACTGGNADNAGTAGGTGNEGTTGNAGTTGDEGGKTPGVTYTKMTEEEWKTAMTEVDENTNYVMLNDNYVVNENGYMACVDHSEQIRDGNKVIVAGGGSDRSADIYGYVLEDDVIFVYSMYYNEPHWRVWKYRKNDGEYRQDYESYKSQFFGSIGLNQLTCIANVDGQEIKGGLADIYAAFTFDETDNSYSVEFKYDNPYEVPGQETAYTTKYELQVFIVDGKVNKMCMDMISELKPEYYEEVNYNSSINIADYELKSVTRSTVTFGNAKISLPKAELFNQ